jgi:DNA-binding ferritin-like protein
MSKLVSVLMHARTQAHVFHLRTASYAQHKALQKFYEGISELLDEYAEAYQGKYGIINGYETYPVTQDPRKAKSFLMTLLKLVDKARKVTRDSYLKNILDQIYELIYSTIYMLSLK